MYCSYHPSNAARVRCSSCGRVLCTYCDHRIKGYPYCQDCIVLGIETLSRAGSRRGNDGSLARRRARVAALCAILPGGGAVYNRQNMKAAVYFIAITGLFQLSALHPFGVVFGLAGAAFYFYTIIDSYRSAELIARGESPAENEKRFKMGLARRIPTVGVLLITSGLLFLLYRMQLFDIGRAAVRLAPVALIMLGGYLVVSYVKRRRAEEWSVDEPPRPALPLFASKNEREYSRRSGER